MTDDFFRNRLDQIIDLRRLLAALATLKLIAKKELTCVIVNSTLQ
jgi:hypothetical protein